MNISNISIEITRRCNLKCVHCCRGNAENVNINCKYIDSLLNQINSIHFLTFTGGEPSLNVPAMQYFIDECYRKNISIDYVAIITNGINIKQDFIDVCIDIHKIVKGINVWLSTDKYHTNQKIYNDSLLKTLPFFKKKPESFNGVILNEGRGRELEGTYINTLARPFTTINSFKGFHNYITLNVYGDIINGIDYSYSNQCKHRMCRVEDLSNFYNFLNQNNMTDNKFVEEDWEKISQIDRMYLIEKEREIFEQWQQWWEEQEELNRLPAKIKILTNSHKLQEDEHQINSLPF